MEKWLFDIDPNGDVITLHTDAINLRELGSLHVSRASRIEFDETQQGWTITLRDGTVIPHTFEQRIDALAYEVAYIQEHWEEFVEAASCPA